MTGQEQAPCSWPELLATLLVLAAASVSPLILTIAVAGYAPMPALVLDALLPAIGLIALILVATGVLGWKRFYQDAFLGLFAGIVGTVGLEIIRIIGFRVFHAMPGSLPMLMGVMITNQFMEGPTLLSNVLGWAYHFWNGASFGLVYLFFFGRRRWWFGIAFGLLVGLIFMASPVVVMTGAGTFGSAIGPWFATTVLLAHSAFGGILGWLAGRQGTSASQWWRCLVDTGILPAVSRETSGR